MLKTSQLACENVDLLNFCLVGVLPSTKNSELGCSYKGELRTCWKKMYNAKLQRNASRLSVISEELDNLPMAAIRLGFPVELMSPPVRETMLRLREGLHRSLGPLGEQRRPSEPLQLENSVSDRPGTSRQRRAPEPLIEEVVEEPDGPGEEVLPSTIPPVRPITQPVISPQAVAFSLPPLRMPSLRQPMGSAKGRGKGRQGGTGTRNGSSG